MVALESEEAESLSFSFLDFLAIFVREGPLYKKEAKSSLVLNVIIRFVKTTLLKLRFGHYNTFRKIMLLKLRGNDLGYVRGGQKAVWGYFYLKLANPNSVKVSFSF
jgi:hypothetical protein